jgi:hypothetical protein
VDDRQKLLEDLKEQKELSELRKNTLEKQQKSLEEKYKEIEQLISKTYSDSQSK